MGRTRARSLPSHLQTCMMRACVAPDNVCPHPSDHDGPSACMASVQGKLHAPAVRLSRGRRSGGRRPSCIQSLDMSSAQLSVMEMGSLRGNKQAQRHMREYTVEVVLVAHCSGHPQCKVEPTQIHSPST